MCSSDLLILLHFFGIKKFAAYLPFGLLLWGLTFASGVHPTVAGVAFALCLPAELLVPLEHRLRPWMSFGVMPLFALANAGLRFAGTGSMEWMHPVSLGVFLGLFLGKQLGIFLASWISVRLGWSELASDSSWSKLSAVSWLGGIGFTMSLFISTLAFRDEALLAQAKLGILSGSIASGFVAFLFLRKAFRS